MNFEPSATSDEQAKLEAPGSMLLAFSKIKNRKSL
jgi:hypothetical protein